MDEVPSAKGALLAFDDEEALAGEHEEVLLRVLAVVHAARLAGREDADVDAEVGEAGLSLEARVGASDAAVVVLPLRLPRVDHEPALALGDEAALGRLQRGFRHASSGRGDAT